MDKLQLESALNIVLRKAFSQPGRLRLAPACVSASVQQERGFHFHDGWELLAPLRGTLACEIAGHPPLNVPAGHLLLVPPRCLHVAADLPQPAGLRMFVVIFPDDKTRYSVLRAGHARDGEIRVLSNDELGRWAQLLGETPAEFMNRVAAGLSGNPFGRQRACSALRLLLSALGEAAFGPAASAAKPANRQVGQALAMLYGEYFKPDLSLRQVAAETRLSAPRLASLFKKDTGRTFHQTLIGIRLKRALDLLREGTLSVKEIAALTGWSNQLYFSAAFRNRFGFPPSQAHAAIVEGKRRKG